MSGIVLNKSLPEDIDAKIRLNQQAGIDIFKLREEIIKERLDFIWMKIRATVQIQLYDEQLDHINARIAAGKIYADPVPEGPSIPADPNPKKEPPEPGEKGLEPIPGTGEVKG